MRMPAFECKRCGRCCRDFHHQIRFTERELSDSKLKENHDKRVQLFFSIRKLQEKHVDGEPCVFVPIFGDLMTLLEHNKAKKNDAAEQLNEDWIAIIEDLLKNIPNQDMNSCLFLEKRGSEFFCSIHENAPEMCKIYPKNHGFVCLGQRERYATKEFFEFQKVRVKSAIDVLKMLFKQEIRNPICFDILTFLMDYGGLPESTVIEFFEKEMNVKNEIFQACVKELVDHSLIYSFKDPVSQHNLLRSVTYEDVNRIVDEIMKRKGWTVL
jgi:Fe-S-cluster containining protein